MQKWSFKTHTLIIFFYSSIFIPVLADDIDDFIKVKMKMLNILGLQLAIIKNNK